MMDNPESRPAEPSSAPSSSPPPKLVVVDIGEPQSPDAIKSLRSGSGTLIDHVERIMADLVASGTVGGAAEPVVFVVRETPVTPDDEDDDDDF